MVQVEAGAIVPLLNVNVVPPLTANNVAEGPQPDNEGETGSARNTLVGRLSVSEAWVRLVLSMLFLITTDRRLVAPAHIVLGLKLLLMVGIVLPVTFSVALAGLVLLIVVPPPVELSAPTGMVLIKLPVVKEVRLTSTVQDPAVDPTWAGTVPPVKVMVVVVVETVPPQVLVTPAGLATRRPGWTPTRLSVQVAFVRAKVLGLKTVMLRTDVSPARMAIGVNFLLISAGIVIDP